MSANTVPTIQLNDEGVAGAPDISANDSHGSTFINSETLHEIPKSRTEKVPHISTTASASDPLIGGGRSHSLSRVKPKTNGLARYLDSKLWITALLLPFAPIIGFAIWLPYNNGYLGLESRSIGGNMTQVQAKIIDFICSVVLAPCIITCFDYLWFSYLRVLAVNEVTPKDSIPIEALATTSSTDSGSFDFIKFITLVSTKKITLVLFGCMIIISGTTKSLLANVIAYEASVLVGGAVVNQTLQALAAPLPPVFSGQPPQAPAVNYNFTRQQQAIFSSQYLSMLTDLSFHSGVDRLEDNIYVGINATTKALNALPPSVGFLSDVPGYRLSIDCRASTPSAMGLLILRAMLNWISQWTGGLESAFGVSGVGGDTYAIAAFAVDPKVPWNLWLGFVATLPPVDNWTDSKNVSETGFPSVFGDIYAFRANLTEQGTALTKIPARVFYIWGVSCGVVKQLGYHDLRRLPSGEWKRVPQASRYEAAGVATLSRMSEWVHDLSYRVPWNGGMPGYGQAFASTATNCSIWPKCVGGKADGAAPMSLYNTTFSWGTMALNALYATGETERMLHEVVMQTTGQNSTFQVPGRLLEQRYRITYVPLLVFGCLLSCLGACTITCSLLIYHWRRQTGSLKAWRKITVRRLLLDAVDGFRNDSDFYGYAHSDNPEVKEWSKKFKVRYVNNLDGNRPVVGLQGHLN